MEITSLETPDSISALAHWAQQDYHTLVLEQGHPTFPADERHGAYASLVGQYAVLPLDSLISLLRPTWAASPQRLEQWKSIPPVHANSWIPVGSDTMRPTAGTVSIVHYIDDGSGGGCTREYSLVVWGPNGCIEDLYTLQELIIKYGSAIRITLVEPQDGEAVFQGNLTAADEAEEYGHFYREYWHLPVTVALVTPLKQSNSPDSKGNISAWQIRNDLGAVVAQWGSEPTRLGSHVIDWSTSRCWGWQGCPEGEVQYISRIIDWTLAQDVNRP